MKLELLAVEKRFREEFQWALTVLATVVYDSTLVAREEVLLAGANLTHSWTEGKERGCS